MRVGLAFGSNLGDSLAQFVLARSRVLALPGVDPSSARCARVYETEPVDCPPGSPKFLNTAMEVEFFGELSDLLPRLQAIELGLDRPAVRPRNSPRPIDLDIIYADDLVLSLPDLVVPHPRAHERDFVLAPFADLAPERVLPGQTRSIADLLAPICGLSLLAVHAETW